jgi:hypothetical protein
MCAVSWWQRQWHGLPSSASVTVVGAAALFGQSGLASELQLGLGELGSIDGGSWTGVWA